MSAQSLVVTETVAHAHFYCVIREQSTTDKETDCAVSRFRGLQQKERVGAVEGGGDVNRRLAVAEAGFINTD